MHRVRQTDLPHAGSSHHFVGARNVYLFPSSSEPQRRRLRDLPGGYFPNTQPGTLFCYHLKEGALEATITVSDASGKEVYKTLSGTVDSGLNVVPWVEMPWSMPIHRAGDYRAVLTIDGKEYVRNLVVEDVTDEDVSDTKPHNNVGY